MNLKNYSIITVTFNSEKTIKRTIDSVLKQKIFPMEYIFIDGGSEDRTLDIIHSYDFNSKGIKFIFEKQEEKSGIYGAINQGIKIATGDIIFILHSDDWLEPDAAELVLAKFAEYPSCDVVLASAFFHSDYGKTIVRNPKNFILFPILMPVIHPASFVSRKTYEKYGLYDEKYRVSADYDFFYRIAKNGAKFCEIRNPVVNIQLGGFANTNRAIARRETMEIGLKYSFFTILPLTAYLLRKILNR